MRNFLFYLLLSLIVFACKDDKPNPNSSQKYRVVGNNELLKGWKTYSNDSIKVNMPSDWKPKNIKQALLYVPIDNKHDLFYVILNYSQSKITCRNYIKEALKQFSKKNRNSTYVLKRVSLKNTRELYIIELFTKEKNIKYKIYSLVYDTGNEIYDFSYKTIDDKKMNDKNYQTFYSVLFSFEMKYDNVFDANKIIIDNYKLIKYQDL